MADTPPDPWTCHHPGLCTLSKSSAGTAVDRWGWDGRKMWEPFRAFQDPLDSLTLHLFRCWARECPTGTMRHCTDLIEAARSCKNFRGRVGDRKV